MTPLNGLLSSFVLITLLAYHVTSAPFTSLAQRQAPVTGKTYVNIGQNYFNEWEGFATAIKTPAGISVYGDIYAGALNPDSVDLLSRYAGQHSSVFLISLVTKLLFRIPHVVHCFEWKRKKKKKIRSST